METQRRLTSYLALAKDDYPEAWKLGELLRSIKDDDQFIWPDYCYLPLAGWYEVVKGDLQVDKVSLPYLKDVPRLAALGAWRYTQSIYDISEKLYQALISTEAKGNIPVEVLLKLPEWCVYIKTPNLKYTGIEVNGFFAHIEHDFEAKNTELRFLFDSVEHGLFPSNIHVGNWSLEEGLNKSLEDTIGFAKREGYDGSGLNDDYKSAVLSDIQPFLSLLLYVCSDGVEYSGQGYPSNPQAKRTRRKGWKLFPAAKPRVWNLGTKLGQELERAEVALREPSDTNAVKGSEKSPHIRRAHWHTFYAGSRSKAVREVRIKWMPPIPVAMRDKEP